MNTQRHDRDDASLDAGMSSHPIWGQGWGVDGTSWTARRRLAALLRKAYRIVGMGRQKALGNLRGGVAIAAILAGMGYAQATFAAGEFNTATGGSGIAIDPVGTNSAHTTNADGIAVGDGANSTGTSATAIGTNAVANGADATATGDTANASGTFATAFGFNTVANGSNATATGANSIANGTAAHPHTGDQWYRRNHQCIERITVKRQRMRHKTIVTRIVHRCCHETIYQQGT